MAKKKTSTTSHLEIFSAETSEDLNLSYIEAGISAGFPSPANDFLDVSIDLNKVLVKNPSATFYGRVKGNSMIDAGLNDGDLLVIDKSLEPKNGKIAVCFIDGEFTIKRIKVEKDKCFLMPANDQYKPIEIQTENDLIIWGIVTTIIKSV